jgi:RimJ/RimL family protein N-acetyltransferase
VLDLITPFPLSAAEDAWEWAKHAPTQSFDDYGPQSLEEFRMELAERNRTEHTWAVTAAGVPVGFVGFQWTSDRTGMMRGIVFAPWVHGRGVARNGVRAVLHELFSAGCEKVSATYFSENKQIDRFLKKLGAVEEGLLRQQTLQGGRPIDMRIVAIFRENFYADRSRN